MQRRWTPNTHFATLEIDEGVDDGDDATIGTASESRRLKALDEVTLGCGARSGPSPERRQIEVDEISREQVANDEETECTHLTKARHACCVILVRGLC